MGKYFNTDYTIKNVGDLDAEAALAKKLTHCSNKDSVAVRSRTSLMTDSGGKSQRELGVDEALVSWVDM